jgi:thiamine-phosphate pyrophosphorylase
MSAPRLVIVLDAAGCKLPVADVAKRALAGGADIVQIRERNMSDQQLRAEIETVLNRLGSPCHVALNSHADLAREYELHLHLPEIEPWPTDWTGSDISRSVHLPLNEIEPKSAYVILGNVLETRSKLGLPGIGYDALGVACQQIGHPVLAIGGMRTGTIGPAIAAGVHGVVVRTAVIGAADPESATWAIRKEIDAWTK